MKKKDLIYLAGALEHRGVLTDEPEVSFRTHGKLPKKLKRVFGGTCFLSNTNKDIWWYKSTGVNARKLLRAVFPHLKLWRRKAEKALMQQKAR